MIKCEKDRRISSVAGDEEEHSIIWGIFMAATTESATFMGKNFQNNQNSIVNTADPTLKQMFVISAKLVTEQDEFSGLETIDWEKHSWKYLYARKFGTGQWSFIGPGSTEQSQTCVKNVNPFTIDQGDQIW